jgi:hypothetical protein
MKEKERVMLQKKILKGSLGIENSPVVLTFILIYIETESKKKKNKNSTAVPSKSLFDRRTLSLSINRHHHHKKSSAFSPLLQCDSKTLSFFEISPFLSVSLP